MQGHEFIVLAAIVEVERSKRKASAGDKLKAVLIDVGDYENTEEGEGHIILWSDDPSQAECKAFELVRIFEMFYPLTAKIRENEDSILVTFFPKEANNA